MKRLLVTGSREFDRADLVEQHLRDAFWQLAKPEYLPWSVTLVYGACPSGADALAVDAWERQGMPIEAHPADWDGPLKKGAGFARNAEMVRLGADLCVAFYQLGAKNAGTTQCRNLAEQAEIPIWEVWSDGEHFREPVGP